MRRIREFARPTALRHLTVPRPSAAPLHGEESEFDDLQLHRTYRVYDEDEPDTVRYFMYELSQRDPGPTNVEHEYFFKSLRLLRVTRVPRYLRQQPESVLAAQRDMLASLRERGVLFVTMLATSPDLPMIFAYGVQAVGRTAEEAQAGADEAYAVLRAQMDGTYQQLEYQPITVTEAETLVRYQSQWKHIAMARGRPMPLDGDGQNINAKLDGNRTDVSSHAAHQLDTFIRGMTDRSFLLTMITTPISPEQMIEATRNLSKKLSEVRSEQQGQRAVTAGVALPLGFGMSLGDTHGASHATGETAGVGISDATSRVVTEGSSEGFSQGESISRSATETVGESYGQSFGETQGVSQGFSESLSTSESFGQTDSESVGVSIGETYGESVGMSMGESVSVSESETFGTSFSQSASESLSESLSQSFGQTDSASVSESASLSQGATFGESWSQSLSDSMNASETRTEAFNQSVAETLSQTIGLSAGETQTDGVTEGQSTGSGVTGSLGLLGSNTSEGQSFAESFSEARSNQLSTSMTGGGSITDGFSESWADSIGRTVGASESVGGSASETVSAGSGVSVSEGTSLSESVGTSLTQGSAIGQTLGQSAGVSTGVTQGATAGQSASQSASQSAAQSASQGTSLTRSSGMTESVGQSSSQSLSQSQSTSQSVSASQSRGMTSGVSQTAMASTSESVADGRTNAESQQQSLSDSYIVAMSHAAQRSTSLGAIPSFGISVSRQTFDEMKRVRGDFLEAQLNRYLEGIRSGAFLYQMYLVCPDRETLAGGAGLLKSAFWGDKDKQLPQPFHVIDRFDDREEAKRLLSHAQAFTTYRKVEERMELIEPFVHSSYVTPGEGAVMCHPPTAESIGLLSVHDSMPVFAMPSDRRERDLYLGHVVNGERAKVSDVRFGVDLSELTHTLVAGATGSGKTTTTMRMVTEAVSASRTVVTRDENDPMNVTSKQVPAGAVCLDWADSFRDLASVVEPERFSFYSVMKPHLGRFRFNPLAIPDIGMDPSSWANTIADLFMLSYGLGEFARSIVWESITELQAVNRLQPYTLRPAMIDDDGIVIRGAIELAAVDPATLPADGLSTSPDGSQIANVYTCPQLSRLIGIPDMAVLVAAKIEELSQPGAANLTGTSMRDRLQTVWRRLMYFAPGEQLAEMFAADPSLEEPEALQLHDLIDPDRGLVTVIETEGLDYENRRFVLGSVLMSLWRFAQFHGDGVFDHNGTGPGTFVILEEAHELFGDQPDDDRETAATRNAIYESLFRRARKYGLRLVACVQNAARVPAAITSNTSTVIAHKQWDADDKRSIAHLMNWKDAIGQHFREVRYLGELADGWAIIRLNPKTHYLQAAPVQIVVDPMDLPPVTDKDLQLRAARRERRAPQAA